MPKNHQVPVNIRKSYCTWHNLLQKVWESHLWSCGRANGTFAIICRYTRSTARAVLEPSSRILVFFVSPDTAHAGSKLAIWHPRKIECVFGIDCNPMHMASHNINYSIETVTIFKVESATDYIALGALLPWPKWSSVSSFFSEFLSLPVSSYPCSRVGCGRGQVELRRTKTHCKTAGGKRGSLVISIFFNW